MAKKVPVTSVTPASKVKATSKAQQARTRGLVMGIAAATPAGRVAKTAATAVKSATKVSSAARANARGLKAANKPLSKGNAKAPFKGGDSANVLKNSPPARANRTRGGSLRTLRAQGKTGPNYQVEIQGKMYSLPAAEKKMAELRKLQGGKN